MASLSIALTSDRSELARLAAAVERFGAEHHLSEDEVMRVNLVLDEIVANVIRHGHAGGRGHQIDVSISVDARHVAVDVVDDGIPFNPLEAPAPNLDLPIEERPIGGLGIHIVKSLAETLEYRRENGRNHLALTIRRP